MIEFYFMMRDYRIYNISLILDFNISHGQAESDLQLFCFDLDDKTVLINELHYVK